MWPVTRDVMMNTNLNKYLSSVFRNELKESYQPHSPAMSFQTSKHQENENKTQQFIVDKIYRLDLDEII